MGNDMGFFNCPFMLHLIIEKDHSAPPNVPHLCVWVEMYSDPALPPDVQSLNVRSCQFFIFVILSFSRSEFSNAWTNDVMLTNVNANDQLHWSTFNLVLGNVAPLKASVFLKPFQHFHWWCSGATLQFGYQFLSTFLHSSHNSG